VIVRGNVPALALVDNETVNVDVAAGPRFTGVGSEQVAPDGQPVTVRSILPLNPLNGVSVTVEFPVPPVTRFNEYGLAEITKSGLEVTVA
jgi:hypothetical protein